MFHNNSQQFQFKIGFWNILGIFILKIGKFLSIFEIPLLKEFYSSTKDYSMKFLEYFKFIEVHNIALEIIHSTEKLQKIA